MFLATASPKSSGLMMGTSRLWSEERSADERPTASTGSVQEDHPVGSGEIQPFAPANAGEALGPHSGVSGPAWLRFTLGLEHEANH
jgi:hypothetical protein